MTKGLYANIHAKRKRIKSQKARKKKPEQMRKPGTKGAPTAKDFKEAEKTAKKKKEEVMYGKKRPTKKGGKKK